MLDASFSCLLTVRCVNKEPYEKYAGFDCFNNRLYENTQVLKAQRHRIKPSGLRPRLFVAVRMVFSLRQTDSQSRPYFPDPPCHCACASLMPALQASHSCSSRRLPIATVSPYLSYPPVILVLSLFHDTPFPTPVVTPCRVQRAPPRAMTLLLAIQPHHHSNHSEYRQF